MSRGSFNRSHGGHILAMKDMLTKTVLLLRRTFIIYLEGHYITLEDVFYAMEDSCI